MIINNKNKAHISTYAIQYLAADLSKDSAVVVQWQKPLIANQMDWGSSPNDSNTKNANVNCNY